MMLSQLSKRHLFLRDPTRLPLLTEPENEEHMLEMTDAAVFMDLLVQAKRLMEVVYGRLIRILINTTPTFETLKSSTGPVLVKKRVSWCIFYGKTVPTV